MPDNFDVAREVKTVDSLVEHAIDDVSSYQQDAYRSDTAHLVDELTSLTPQQLKETLAAMGAADHGIIRPWSTKVGTESVTRDADGNVTGISFGKDSGIFATQIDGTVTVDLMKKSVSTSAWDDFGRPYPPMVSDSSRK